jgi:hypothetical protein
VYRAKLVRYILGTERSLCSTSNLRHRRYLFLSSSHEYPTPLPPHPHLRLCVPNLVTDDIAVLEKKSKMLKSNRQIDRQSDDRQRAIRKAHLSFYLRWANKKVLSPNLSTKISMWQRTFGWDRISDVLLWFLT